MSEKKSRSASRSVRERTEVPASEVKNSWHEYIERVSQGREEIIVTRYGKPVMKLVPSDEVGSEPAIFGFPAGTVTEHGDLTEPTGEIWDADA